MTESVTKFEWIEGEVVPANREGVVVPASSRDPKMIRGFGNLSWTDQANPEAPRPLTEALQIFVRGVIVAGTGHFIVSTLREEEETP